MTEQPPKAVIRARPFCIGCGMYFAVHGEHRSDCTDQPKKQKDDDHE